MKFLCDNCKAKYQIADEKVAGKTVRMKCRKCGHQIEIRAAVTETSVSGGAPRPTGAPRPPQRSGLATSLSATKPRNPSTSGSSLAGAFKSNIQETPASVPSDGTGKGTIELSVTDEWYVAINGVPVGPVRISELRRKAAAGAVNEDSLCWQEGLEEWRPIRTIPDLAALVREAAMGNRPSLISAPAPEPPPAPRSPTVPSEPKQPAQRSSLVPSEPKQPAQRTSHAPQAPRPPAPLEPRPMAPSAPSAPRSNVVPLRPAASSSLDDVGLGGGAAAAAAAFAPSPSLAPSPPSPLLSPAPQPQAPPLSAPMPIAAAADSFAVPPAPATAPLPPPFGAPPPGAFRESSAGIAPAPSFVPQQPAPVADASTGKKKGVPLWFIPIPVLALGFGLGLAYFVSHQPPPQPVVIQMAPTTTAPAPTVDEVDTPAASASSSVETPSPTNETKTKHATASKTKAPAPAATEEKKGLDLGNLVPGTGGPSVGPSKGPGASGGGLDQAGVERVVQNHRAAVKRTCWERAGGDKGSVNVTVTANIAPNGTVASTSSAGDDPVVAKCIENQVRAWTFPAPGSSTTINIPFKFVRQ
jgi:predicted Zn finger-like uncharacterized protein